MDIRQLSDTYFVAPQIAPEMMAAIGQLGITRILCNRPDCEVPAPLGAEYMREAARNAGLEFEVQTLTHQTMTPEVIDRNYQIGAARPGVTLAYCASGTRSCIAWALAQAGREPADHIIAAGRAAGYDLEGLRSYLESAAT